MLLLAEQWMACVIGKILELDLKVKVSRKTGAIWFHGLRKRQEAPSSCLWVDETEVQVGQYKQYLDLILDSR